MLGSVAVVIADSMNIGGCYFQIRATDTRELMISLVIIVDSLVASAKELLHPTDIFVFFNLFVFKNGSLFGMWFVQETRIKMVFFSDTYGRLFFYGFQFLYGFIVYF